jgi:hypothetical protein
MICKHCKEDIPGGWFTAMEHDAICDKKPKPPVPGTKEWLDKMLKLLEEVQIESEREKPSREDLLSTYDALCCGGWDRDGICKCIRS